MRIKTVVLGGAAATVLGLAAMAGTGAAFAASTPSPAPVVPGAVVQSVGASQGSQTGPDTESTAPESTGSETPGVSDGPGGHEDPAGTVDHQFDGQE